MNSDLLCNSPIKFACQAKRCLSLHTVNFAALSEIPGKIQVADVCGEVMVQGTNTKMQALQLRYILLRFNRI